MKPRLQLATLRGLAVAGCIAGCTYQPTSGQRAASVAPFASARVGGEALSDFLDRRIGLLIVTSSAIKLNPTSSAINFDRRLEFTGGCSAAVDRRGYYLTAAHCIGPGTILLGTLGDQNQLEWHKARLVWRGDPHRLDLAILRLSTPCKDVFEWSEVFEPKESVLCEGVDFIPSKMLLETHQCAGAILNAAHQTYSDIMGTLVYHTAPLYEGDSGGPLVNLEGQLIGINCGADGLFPVGHHHFVIPLVQLRQKSVRPNMDWLRETIDADFKAHENG